MSDKVAFLSPRAEEKHLQREQDRLALVSGQKRKEQLRQENGFFAVDAQIDLSSSDF